MLTWTIVGLCIAVIVIRIVGYFLDRGKKAKLEEALVPGLTDAIRERAARAPVTRDESSRDDSKVLAAFHVAVPTADLVKPAVDNLKRDIALWFNRHGLDCGEATACVDCPAELFPAVEAAFAEIVLAAPRMQELARLGCPIRVRRRTD